MSYLAKKAYFILSLLFVVTASWAEPIAVIYPEVREAYKKVFENITEGAESELGQKLLLLELASNTSTQKTGDWISENNVSAIIALSKKSLSQVDSDPKLPIVVGSIAYQPPSDGYSGISLNPAPERLFTGLKFFLPELHTVHVVFDPKRNRWEVEAATKLAKKIGITVQSYPAKDLRQAATAYRDIQKNMDPNTDALWLPLGSPARDKAILQNILETAWVKKQAVVSSNLADVKRGVLFAMYPDNIGMGKDLGKLLNKVINQTQKEPEIYFTTALFQAINRRTAEHLDMRLRQEDFNNFNFIYPPR